MVRLPCCVEIFSCVSILVFISPWKLELNLGEVEESDLDVGQQFFRKPVDKIPVMESFELSLV